MLPEPWPPHKLVLCSKKASQEPSGSVQPATAQPSIQLHASPAAAAALATSLAGLVKGHSWPGYQLLGQLAVTDIQDGNERVTGIAQHVMSFTLKVGFACQAFAQECLMLIPCTLHMPGIRMGLCKAQCLAMHCCFHIYLGLMQCSERIGHVSNSSDACC